MSNHTNLDTMTWSGYGIALGVHASGARVMLPCSFAAPSVGGVTPKRRTDAAMEHDQGTLVWSPPT